MSQVQFDEAVDTVRRDGLVPGNPTGILKLLIDLKVARDEKHAERVALLLAGAALMLAFAIPFMRSMQKDGNPSAAELNRYIQLMNGREGSAP